MPRSQSIQSVPGYGKALLARLKSIRLTQVGLANAAGVSRQTISRVVGNDEASPQTIRRIEDVLGRHLDGQDAVVAERSTTESSVAKRSRPSRAWVSATDLADWSNRRSAQDELPQIIRRLILMTVDSVRQLSFPAGEGVQLRGWDGRVTAPQGNAFVPDGESVWELGTGSSPSQKAQADYDKRITESGTADLSGTTFVFVTSRRWSQKHEWAIERKSERRWKDVRVIDADDLEAWLEFAPSVHIWLSGRIGTFPDGVQDLAYWWDTWLSATRPPLTAEFLAAGRSDQVTQIQDWRRSNSAALPVRAESRQEAVAVAAAAFVLLAPADAEDAIARVVIVDEPSAWRRMVVARTRLILIPTFDIGDEVAAATRAGHAVLIPLGEGDVEVASTLTLPPISRSGGAAAMVAAGETSEERARDSAGIARRSMTALRRRLAVATSLQHPAWARPAVARNVLPALFASGWNEKVMGDRTALERLGRKPYDQVSDDVAEWTHGADPLLRRRGGLWYLVSREDAWDLLARYVKREDAERFEAAVIEVFTTPDPRFDLPNDQRWMAEIYGKKAPYSGMLRSSIASTLALIGARADKPSDNLGGFDNSPLRYTAEKVVKDVLAKANSDWRVWASLSGTLGEFGESAPDAFLDALESGLRDPGAPISQLFTDESDALFGSSPHTGLLWALERLAWSPDYLSRVVEILADLKRKDPGGKTANRPSASLNAIFRPWLPQTAAGLDRRFKVLDALAKRDADSTWDILISTLPEFHAVGFPAARPRWRDWANDLSPNVKRAEYEAAIVGAVERLLALAGHSGSRWAALIESLPQLGLAERRAILERLSSIDPVPFDDEGRTAIWTAMRTVVASHRRFPNAEWAMAEEYVAQIDSVRERFIPEDVITRYKWLFSWQADLPDAKAIRSDDHSAYQLEVQHARNMAVRNVEASLGLAGLIALAAVSDEAQFVGSSAAEEGLCLEAEDTLLRENLASNDRHRDIFARSFAATRASATGGAWVATKLQLLAAELLPAQKAALLTTLPSEMETWRLAESLGEDVERAYWSLIWHVRKDDDLSFALRKLLAFGRVGRAVDIMGMYAHTVRVDPMLILEGLERLLDGEVSRGELSNSFGQNLGKLLDCLANEASIDRSKVARLEWGFLSVLPSYAHDPTTLHRALGEEPNFFADLVGLAFRAEGEPKKGDGEFSDEDRQRATRAYSLLASWRTLPGIREDGTVDQTKLAAWVNEARERLTESGRLRIGDQQIGQMLSGAPSDKDGTWPCEPVRAIIEQVRSADVETGLEVGLYNGRGVRSRALDAGGKEERALAERYEGFAAAVADTSSRTAAMLRGIAASYRSDAVREDERLAIDEDLDR